MSLPGKSKTITVEPLREYPPVPEPERVPERQPEPVRTPEKVPA